MLLTRFYIVIGYILLANISVAQNILFGNIRDRNSKKFIEFATVQLLQTVDSTVLQKKERMNIFSLKMYYKDPL